MIHIHNNINRAAHDRESDIVPVADFKFPHLKKLAREPRVMGPAGEVFDFTLTGKETDKKFLVATLSVPPQVGPPPHIHFFLDEWFYAPDGGFCLYAGGRRYQDISQVPGETAEKDLLHVVPMPAQSLFYVPHGRIHGFMNTSTETKLMQLVWTPDDDEHGILDYFQSAGIQVEDMNVTDSPSFMSQIRLVTHAKRRGINQSTHFWQYVSDVSEEFPDFLRDNHADALIRLLEPYIDTSTTDKGVQA